ncbi:MAG: ABC-2 family transporter protein [Chloroflexi bacterium]|nr:ABC-2 family transporter protein [Chloroflexota bacterium]
MMKKEITFLLHLWRANLIAAMEFRVAFLSQVIGMMLNNALYFLFWIIFFDRFQNVRGWGLNEMFILFGIVAVGYGAGVFLFGNVMQLADVIATGKLDYYLSLPRPVLLHVLASRSLSSGLGDFTYGILSLLVAGVASPDAIARIILGAIFSMIVFLAFMTLINSLGFWMGNATMLAFQAGNAMLTFALYPITLFDGTGKFILFTIIPAAFMGAVPAELIRAFDWFTLAQLFFAALVLLALALFVFRRGLRRYESGSAIQIQS